MLVVRGNLDEKEPLGSPEVVAQLRYAVGFIEDYACWGDVSEVMRGKVRRWSRELPNLPLSYSFCRMAMNRLDLLIFSG